MEAQEGAWQEPSAYRSSGATPVRTGRDEIAALGLLAARVAMAARRVMSGMRLDETDRLVLDRASKFLASEAKAIRFVESGGAKGREPSNVASAGFAADLFIGGENDEVNHKQLAAALSQLASLLRAFSKTEDRRAAAQIADVFERIAAWARTEAGSPGDRVIGRDWP